MEDECIQLHKIGRDKASGIGAGLCKEKLSLPPAAAIRGHPGSKSLHCLPRLEPLDQSVA